MQLVLKELILTQFLLWEGVVTLKELILNSFYFGNCVVVLKELILEQFLLWEGLHLESTDFEQFLLWEGLVLKELFWTVSTLGGCVWSWNNWFWTVSTLGGCTGLERTDFEQFLLWEGVVLINKDGFITKFLNIFYFGRVHMVLKEWFCTVSTLGGCGGLERTDFEHFLLWEGVVVLKELILNSFYFGRV